MFQLWQELINGRNCEFKLTRNSELIPQCVGVSLRMALSAKRWSETFCELRQNSASPDPKFSPRSFPLAIVSQYLVPVSEPLIASSIPSRSLFPSQFVYEFGSHLLSLRGPSSSDTFSTSAHTDQSLPDTPQKLHGYLWEKSCPKADA